MRLSTRCSVLRLLLLLVAGLFGPLSSPLAAELAVPPVAAQLVGGALLGDGAYGYVRELSDRVGARLSGSVGAERAVDWALQAMRQAGLKNVHKEPVRVPHWVRGEESGEVLTPTAQPLKLTALGGSVGTPAGGLSGELIEASSLEELGRLGERVRGRIVLLNRPMVRTPDFVGYAEAVPLRGSGATAAAKLGAKAVLVRSIGTGLHRLPHTGTLRYQAGVTQIPAAALAAEDAELLHRLLADAATGSGGEPVRVRLQLGAKLLPEVDSFNVIGEVPGRELPDEVVLIGAHLDAWDLGTGALDDGAGCGIVLDSARLLMGLAQPPRRTVRVVLFMNEEMGLQGARAYAERHRAELPRHVAALEADSGAGLPYGYRLAGGEPARALIKSWVAPLKQLVPDQVVSMSEVGADLIPLQALGVPVLAVDQDVADYFEWHHTAGDTLDKINRRDLALTTAAVAALTWAAAESPQRLPPSPPPSR